MVFVHFCSPTSSMLIASTQKARSILSPGQFPHILPTTPLLLLHAQRPNIHTNRGTGVGELSISGAREKTPFWIVHWLIILLLFTVHYIPFPALRVWLVFIYYSGLLRSVGFSLSDIPEALWPDKRRFSRIVVQHLIVIHFNLALIFMVLDSVPVYYMNFV